MAHFLSEATHQRLELRDVPDDLADEDQAYSTGVIKTHVFQSAMRAVAVVDNCHSDDRHALGRYAAPDATAFAAAMSKSLRRGALDVTAGMETIADAMPRLQVWSGDTIGTVTARLGLTGAPQHVLVQPREKGVYAYSMHHHDPYVWVGLSDGFLHIFEASTGIKCCEMRAHTAAINAITTVANYVFTAGSDWQIIQWDPIELKRVPHGQFSGHQNAVRCLAGTTADSSASGVLYSGGDDYVVRCWDLDTGYERSDPWPIIGHSDAVRCIAVHGIYLFSASADGQVKAWNTQTAQLVRTLDDRGPGVQIGAMSVDAASPAVWAGGTDGVIRMWNAQTLALIGERTDHHATHVAMITTVARANAVKAWMLDASGSLVTVFSDPDGACSTNGLGGYKSLQPLEQELQRQVDVHRVKILQNYTELERCRDEFEGLQASERENKSKFAVAAARHHKNVLNVTFRKQGEIFADKQQMKRNFADQAVARQNMTARAVMRRYFSTWSLVTQGRNRRQQRAAVLQAANASRRRALEVHYTASLFDHVRKSLNAVTRRRAAAAFASYNALLVLRTYMGRWNRARLARKLDRQRQPFVTACQKLSSFALQTAYWIKMRNAVVADRSSNGTLAAVKRLENFAPDFILRSAWSKWIQLKSTRRDANTRAGSVTVLESVQDREVVGNAFERWRSWVQQRRLRALKAQLEAEEQELAEIKAMVAASEGINEQALEATLAAKQVELVQLRQQEHVWDARLRRAATRKRGLQREALRCPAIQSDQPLKEQLTQAIYLLKARGVNLKHNQEDILLARQAAAESSSATIFSEGLGMVRKVCAAVVRPNPLTDPGDICWFIGDMFEKITERQVLKAAQGLSRMVTAFDMVNVKQLGQQWLTTLPSGEQQWAIPQFAEAVENLGTLLELALRAHRIRRGEDMRTGGAKSEHRIRSRSRSKSRSRTKSSSRSKSKRRTKSATKPAEAPTTTETK